MPEFIRQAATCMDEESKKSFIDYIAEHPLQGDLIAGTGGVRKYIGLVIVSSGSVEVFELLIIFIIKIYLYFYLLFMERTKKII